MMDELENPELAASSSPTIRQQDGADGTAQTPIGSDEQAKSVPIEPNHDGAGRPGQLSIETDVDSLLASTMFANNPGMDPSPLSNDNSTFAVRPLLSRNASNPRPAPVVQSPHPLEIPNLAQGDPPDSLTLAELRRLRSEFPGPSTAPDQEVPDLTGIYDFEYQDAQGFEVEMEEWFGYSSEERRRLEAAADTFESAWTTHTADLQEKSWAAVEPESRQTFMASWIARIHSDEAHNKTEALQILCYLVLGLWRGTAQTADPHPYRSLRPEDQEADDSVTVSTAQIPQMISNICMAVQLDVLQVLFDVTSSVLDRDLEESLANMDGDLDAVRDFDETKVSNELWCCLTIVYAIFECVRIGGTTEPAQLLQKISSQFHYSFLHLFTKTIARLRWDEEAAVPLHKLALLQWKCILLTFGGVDRVESLKAAIKEPDETDHSQSLITASPLDYHLFRQEISSKYPAYQAPRPIFDFEPENNTMLPPLKRRRPDADIAEATNPEPASRGINSNSIMHQPVHIATPAPSPPPSPAATGKGVKKQNYQTNQMFPFLYPPLDATSNELGGRGTTELQDALVGRKWTGSDVPASILEAAELFAKRMRATRAMKQLWQTRVEFMKAERGWRDEASAAENIEHLSLYDDEDHDDEADLEPASSADATRSKSGRDDHDHVSLEPEIEPRPGESDDNQRLLDDIDRFYSQSLPHLQSTVVVLLRSVLKTVASLVAVQGDHASEPRSAGNAPEHQQAAAMPDNINNSINGELQLPLSQQDGRQNSPAAAAGAASGYTSSSGSADSGVAGRMGFYADGEQTRYHVGLQRTFSAAEEDATRALEVAAKALSATLLLLLKWFKVSHVLRYEYLTQLLLDANYIPLVLKLWQSQDVGRWCHFTVDRAWMGFFTFCKTDAQFPGRFDAKLQLDALRPRTPEPAVESASDADEAAPPPIKLATTQSDEARSEQTSGDISGLSMWTDYTLHPPEIDELGYQVTRPAPPTPFKTYSWRNIFSTINHLRILQKITHRKAHRSLLLVSYKSSAHLKKLLRVPVEMLRYYTLKLFKAQVPYCGRKWRQSNMKIITAVWLSVPAELRDDWLSGGGGGMGGAGPGDVDGTVEEALPLEQSLRSLTYWWNLRQYPVEMGVDRGLVEDGRNFFDREIERLGPLVDETGSAADDAAGRPESAVGNGGPPDTAWIGT